LDKKFFLQGVFIFNPLFASVAAMQALQQTIIFLVLFSISLSGIGGGYRRQAKAGRCRVSLSVFQLICKHHKCPA